MIPKLVRYAYEKEPAATLGLINLVAGAAVGLTGHPEFTPVLVAVALAFLGVRAKVVPTAKAAETATAAATTAAVEVAKNLTDGTAGAVGEVTGGAARVVDEALELAAGLIGGKR